MCKTSNQEEYYVYTNIHAYICVCVYVCVSESMHVFTKPSAWDGCDIRSILRRVYNSDGNFLEKMKIYF